MKLATLTLLASAAVGNCGLVSRHASSQKLLAVTAEKPENSSGLPFFGDTRCPCIGFDNIAGGETTVDFNGQKVAYPADLGSRCEPWDDGRNPHSCQPGQDPGPGKGFCGKMWCYVDPCNCDIDVLPKLSVYVKEAIYHGKPLFYSYATCGDKNEFTTDIPEVGKPSCRCIGFDNMPGTTEVKLDSGKKVMYPAEIGGSCEAWDKKVHPDCLVDKPPEWCTSNWCYVDPCACGLGQGVVPKISSYLPNSTFTGKSLYYSYETCNSQDTWTKTEHKTACVNQATKEECDMHPRCTWAGSRCLGTELVDHPLCKGVADKMFGQKSGAAQIAPRTTFMMALAGAAAASSLAVLGFEL